MIQIESLTRVYGSRARTVHALRGVSLTLGPGVWAIVGPNGAGKTTLLGLVLGLLRPTSGTVRIRGESPERFVRRHGAVYLPERFRLPPEWPVRGALIALARLEGMGPGEARRRADTALDRTGLTGLAERRAGTLSRGLNQRLGLAQALLAERALVVLDEPADGLDPLWRVRLRELVAVLADGDRTVLLASHELAEVERVADRVVVLDDGRVKDVMDAREQGAAVRFAIDADAPPDAWAAAFPDAEAEGDVRMVTVADERELSHRLAGLLEAGAVVRAVTPMTEALEDRVRRRLESP
jgi:ABC-2 type transport system ATP-binding protein